MKLTHWTCVYVLLSAILLPATASADSFAGFGPAELLTATQSSLELFAKANGSHAQHLTGFKTWKSGNDAKVKIYVSHDGMNMEYNYACALNAGAVACVAN